MTQTTPDLSWNVIQLPIVQCERGDDTPMTRCPREAKWILTIAWHCGYEGDPAWDYFVCTEHKDSMLNGETMRCNGCYQNFAVKPYITKVEAI